MNNSGIVIAVGIVGGFLFLAWIICTAQKISEFQSELRYLNMEINRTRGREREHYRRERRRLWLSLLPFGPW